MSGEHCRLKCDGFETAVDVKWISQRLPADNNYGILLQQTKKQQKQLKHSNHSRTIGSSVKPTAKRMGGWCVCGAAQRGSAGDSATEAEGVDYAALLPTLTVSSSADSCDSNNNNSKNANNAADTNFNWHVTQRRVACRCQPNCNLLANLQLLVPPTPPQVLPALLWLTAPLFFLFFIFIFFVFSHTPLRTLFTFIFIQFSFILTSYWSLESAINFVQKLSGRLCKEERL